MRVKLVLCSLALFFAPAFSRSLPMERCSAYEYHPPFHDTTLQMTKLDNVIGAVVVPNQKSLALATAPFLQSINACGLPTPNPTDYGLFACTPVLTAKHTGYPESLRVFGANFIHVPSLRRTITDSHFRQRDRMGRTLVFLARMLHDDKLAEARAIAIDERTAALIEPDGSSRVAGFGHVYFLRARHQASVIEPGKPLSMPDIEVWRAGSGGQYTLQPKRWRDLLRSFLHKKHACSTPQVRSPYPEPANASARPSRPRRASAPWLVGA